MPPGFLFTITTITEAGPLFLSVHTATRNTGPWPFRPFRPLPRTGETKGLRGKGGLHVTFPSLWSLYNRSEETPLRRKGGLAQGRPFHFRDPKAPSP